MRAVVPRCRCEAAPRCAGVPSKLNARLARRDRALACASQVLPPQPFGEQSWHAECDSGRDFEQLKQDSVRERAASVDTVCG